MADTKISALTAASALTGAELVPGVQSGNNVKVTPSNVAAYDLGTVNLIADATNLHNTTTNVSLRQFV